MKNEAAQALDEAEASGPQLGSRRLLNRASEAGALGALLDCACRMNLKGGPSGVAREVLDTLAAVFPSRAFGVCLVEVDGGDPWVEMRLPVGSPDPGRNPTRLFPDFCDEHVFELEGLSGSTLHVASLAGRFEGEAPELAITEQAADLLAAGGRAALALRAVRPTSAHVAELREQLIQAEKLATLGQIVAGVVHELANPVTSIVACTEYLLRRASAAESRVDEVEQLKRISIAADRILKFSRDLVSYARPASEQPGPVVLPEIVEQAFAFSEHELERSSVRFSCDYGEGAPAVLGQSGPLTQVFINLFTNAAHAMSDHGGTLSVRTRVAENEGRLYVDVMDSGVGIASDYLPKIFEPFFTTKEKGRGTGLGLSIVREIVEAHGGTVDAASTAGEGTTFTVALPLFTRGC